MEKSIKIPIDSKCITLFKKVILRTSLVFEIFENPIIKETPYKTEVLGEKFFLKKTLAVEFFRCARQLALKIPYKNSIGLKKRKCVSGEIMVVLHVLHGAKNNFLKAVN